jgi:hypothetical protein
MGAVEQMELFPSAKNEDVEAAIKLLEEDYRQWIASVKVLSKIKEPTPEQQEKLDAYQEKIDIVNTTINGILDEEARNIIRHRYIKSERRKNTVAHFRGIMSESTIDRRIEKGILSIANTLKDCGII